MQPSTRFAWFAIGLLVPATAFPQQRLLLTNGDRLTGRLKEIADSIWVFTLRANDVAVPVDSVAGLLVTEPIGLRLADGSVLAASVSPAGDSLTLFVSDGSIRTVHPRDVRAVGPATDLKTIRLRRYGLLTPLFQSWSFTGSLGFSDKRGNSRARGVSTGFQVQRKTKRDRLELGASAASEESEGPTGGLQTTVAKGSQFFQADLYVTPRLFLTAQTRQEQDRFQDITLRSTYTVGLGVQVVATPRTDFRVNITGGLRREDFVSGGEAVTRIAGVAAALQQSLGRVILNWRVTWDPQLSDVGNYRFVSNGSVTTRLYKGFGLRFDVLEEYNSRPRPGIERNDLLTSTTLTYAIGR